LAAVALDEALRRIKPEKRASQLTARPIGARITTSAVPSRLTILVPDTSVYIHAASGRLSPAAKALLGAAIQYHSAAALGEIAAGFGNLSPTHYDYAAVRSHYAALMGAIPVGRVLVPDESDWLDAGLLADTLAHTQGFQANQRKELLNGALIYVCAAKAGLPVLTNDDDFDLLQQVRPQESVIFY
jgi:predicted nucleic acid-binding protein